MKKNTKQAGRSVERPGLPKVNPSGLPYGCGSIQMRGKTWWAIYRDGEGRTIQENTKTDDQNIARLMVTERALETARAKVSALEAIIHEATEAGYSKLAGGWAGTQGGSEARDRGEHAGRSRSVRGDAGGRKEAQSTKTRGGKR
jgi:hypothetical protein